VAHADNRPCSANDVFVQVLARAETECEPTVAQELHRRPLLRDDRRVVTADRTCHVRHQGNAVRRLRRRAEDAPRVGRVALRVEPGKVVVADDREVEAGLSPTPARRHDDAVRELKRAMHLLVVKRDVLRRNPGRALRAWPGHGCALLQTTSTRSTTSPTPGAAQAVSSASSRAVHESAVPSR
jgi:hypothetical protein